ncbi:MAG: ATP-dependent protease ATPase subunit HslU [Deltaproteobacteria bacterium]|jgi:ATP-dependent HslUV protease ATP-binding subunit HslU|nr:ATP-dependent protease ATPase subunit HslU [Deltaproteobacteria bacterium]
MNILEKSDSPEVSLSYDADSALSLTPKVIVSILDRFIIGQAKAKRSVAIAMRNRWRRLVAPEDLKEEITPKNIIMIGPTGVGKTEIARRLAKLTKSPFIKVEASKFTEVGYVGRDVESIIRDLIEQAVGMVKSEMVEINLAKATDAAMEKLVELLIPILENPANENRQDLPSTKKKLKQFIKEGKLDDTMVEISVDNNPTRPQIFASFGLEDLEKNINETLATFMPKKSHRRKVPASQALELLTQQEASNLVDQEKVVEEARKRVEQQGLVFIDEIDKICVKDGHSHGPDVSREGVQRDLLPLVEGSTVMTKYGLIKTDHILFIAAGAFHSSKPSDLMPELQGRFPIRVELSSLTKEDFVRILKEPQNALIKQYRALMATEGVDIDFTPEAIEELAAMAFQVNETNENIGARRLSTIMESLLDEVSFEAPDISPTKILVTPDYVRERLTNIVADADLSKFIL